MQVPGALRRAGGPQGTGRGHRGLQHWRGREEPGLPRRGREIREHRREQPGRLRPRPAPLHPTRPLTAALPRRAPAPGPGRHFEAATKWLPGGLATGDGPLPAVRRRAGHRGAALGGPGPAPLPARIPQRRDPAGRRRWGERAGGAPPGHRVPLWRPPSPSPAPTCEARAEGPGAGGGPGLSHAMGRAARRGPAEAAGASAAPPHRADSRERRPAPSRESYPPPRESPTAAPRPPTTWPPRGGRGTWGIVGVGRAGSALRRSHAAKEAPQRRWRRAALAPCLRLPAAWRQETPPRSVSMPRQVPAPAVSCCYLKIKFIAL